MSTWQKGQRVSGKRQYTGKCGTVVEADGWVSKPSEAEANRGGEKVHVKWDCETGRPDVVEDMNLEKI